MNKIILKPGAEDIKGKLLDNNKKYTLIGTGFSHSIISDGHHNIYINNKYIKK